MAKIVLRNDSKENWSVIEEEVILLKGELAIEFDENFNAKLKVGDGINVWKDLPYIIADNKLVDEELTKLNTDLETLKAQVEQQTQLIGENAAALVDVKNVNEEQELKLNSAHARINTLIDNFSDNAAYDNAEVVDIRTGYDGTLHPSAGDAVRAIGYGLYNLSKDLQDFVGEEAVDGLLYESNKLYLTANGAIVSDPVEIVSGTGGGGGSTNEYIITLVNLLDSRVISVTEKDTVKLDFEYSSIDEENYPDGPGIGTVTVNNVRKVTLSIPQGFNSLDVTPYLAKGQNTVRIQVENAEGSKKTLTYTVNVLALSITTTVAQMGLYSGAITIPYTVSGQGTKTVHFLMDNKEFATVNVDTSGQSRQQSIPVQRDGAHILKMYAEVESEGLMISSNTVSLGMLYYSNETTTQAILMMNNDIKEIDQGETISFPYLVYDPFTENAQIELCIIDENGENYYHKELTIDQTPKVWTTQDYPAGNTVFQIKCDETVQSHTIKVNPSTFNKTVITDGCVLDFNANGRSNGEANPESWSYGEDISATFSGFGWANADGWLDDENGQTMLRFLPGNTMTINYKPFASDFRSNGYTIETELATHNVRDYDSIVISAMNGGRGLLVKSQQASLKSEQTGISIQFKEDSRVRLTFVVEQKTLNRFIYVYVNGVMCGVIQYPENDDFSQVSPVDITIGAESCGLDLYILRLYNKGFTRTEQLNNFICDRPTLAERIAADERNDILNEYTSSITIQDLPMDIPYMIIECEELPQFKGDKKKEKSVTYVEPMRPERSFTATGVQLDVQGTSSAGYPIKNYKVSLEGGLTYTNSGTEAEGFPIIVGGLEGKNICLKADFASSEQANNVMLVDYYEQNCPFKTPPQETDGRIRQGVRGFPCVVFWHDTVNNVTTFIGKYNFNDDKSNENVFGFDREKYPNCECWEFRNNTSDRVLFNRSEYEEWGVDEDGKPIEAWRLDFEARFPDLDNPYKDYTQFKRMTDWVVSTNRSLVDDEEEKAARLQKFKDEFEDYFEKDAMIFYYLFTEVFLLADNRAKNMFLTTFDGEHWFPIPYDMDTAVGINNEGNLVFEYDLEDTDHVDGANVFTGQNSALWHNVRDAFSADIREMYQTLRSGSVFNYKTINEKMTKHQTVWPEALWNEDEYNKYIGSYINKGEDYLEMLQGDKRAQRDWWLFNGFKYRDSKYAAGEAASNFITLRCYEVGDITVTPYSHIWPRIKYGSVTTTCRGKRNISYVMPCALDEMDDTEVYIYSADRIASVGDLSHLKVGLAIFSAATKLQEIILGSDEEGYENTNLYSLEVGNNELLTLINIQNCSNEKLTQLDTSGCHALETILAKGTKLSGINLPNGGHLKEVELPATLTNLTIQNQKELERLVLEGQENISTLCIENTPNLDIEQLVNNSPSLSRVRLINTNWEATSQESLRQTIDKLKSCIGIDANGNNTNKAVVVGRVAIKEITNEFLEEIIDNFPELIMVVDGVAKFFVRYLNSDNTLLYRQIVDEGEDAIDPIISGDLKEIPYREDTEDTLYEYSHWSELPTNISKPYNIIARYNETYRVIFQASETLSNIQWIAAGEDAVEPVAAKLMSTPTKESTDQYDFEFIGWDGEFINITQPKILEPVFKEVLRQYWCRFWNGTESLQESLVYWGETPKFVGDTSTIFKKFNGEVSEYYEFSNWSPSPDDPIVGPMNYYAQFAFDGYIEDDWATIAEACQSGDVSKYGLGSRKQFEFTLDGITSTVEVEIVGKNMDKLETPDENYNGGQGTAALTFMLFNLGSQDHSINDTPKTYLGNTNYRAYNTGGWFMSDMRSWLNEDVYEALPEDLKSVIRPVEKISDTGFYYPSLKTTIDKLWLPSDEELNGAVAGQVIMGQGTPYPVFTNNMSRVKVKASNGQNYIYWTRSSGITNMNFFRYVDLSGNLASNNANSKQGVEFGFCV